MRISVIIPTYNRQELIKFTLESLSSLTHPGVDAEIIVVDDGSTDGTKVFIAENYPRVKLLGNKGKGAAAARNTGLAAANGKYIMYLDSDDLVGEHFFLEKIQKLEKESDLTACYGEYDSFQSDGAFSSDNIIFKHKYPIIFSADKSRQHLINYLSGNFLPPNSIIWKKDFLIKINGHDESLAINQDVDLFIRAIFDGLKIVAVKDNTKVYVRSHSLDNRVGDPSNSQKKWVQILELRKKIFGQLNQYGYNDQECLFALSSYLFSYWKKLRHTMPELAGQYLNFAKQVYWPVKIKGNAFYRILSKLFGPVNAVNIKYFLLKRD